MTLIIDLILITALYMLIAKPLKKYSVIFYIGIYIWQAVVVFYYALKFNESMPSWFTTYFMDVFAKGTFSTMTFVIVMFLGCFRKPNFFTKRLMKVRGEMSIIGCFSILCHNIYFGITYFPAILSHPELMPWRHLVATILTVILLTLMIPLLITSFITVRKKMKAKTWKNIQRLAYPFFLIIYVHAMIIFSGDVDKYLSRMIIYSVIFGLYVVMRLGKHFAKQREKKAKLQG